MVAFSPSIPRSPRPIRGTASSCRNAITADRAAPERVRSWADFTGCAFIISAWRCRDRAISSRACRRRPQACIERRSRRLSKRAHKYSNLSPISGWVARCRHRKKERRTASSSATACGATSNSRRRPAPINGSRSRGSRASPPRFPTNQALSADPLTFRVRPWAQRTGWVLCDIYFADGRPVPFSTRHLYRRVLQRLAEAGFDYVAGLEVEFHIFKLDNPRLAPSDATWPGEAPQVSLLSQGYQYLTETRFDQIEPVLETLRRDMVALGLPLRWVELELCRSQCEFTFQPQVGLSPADTMMLFRSAVKQICRRQGCHATFMTRPKLENVMSSGWHLHQSLRDRRSSANVFTSNDNDGLSRAGRGFLAGLLPPA